MTELAKAKRRIQALEKCLRDVSALLYERAVELNAAGADREDRPEYRMSIRVHSRIERTLRTARKKPADKTNNESNTH